VANLDSNSEAKAQRQETSDPVLATLGMGAELWQDEPGDGFVTRLRREDPPPTGVNTDGESL